MAWHVPGPLYYERAGTTGLPMIFLHSTPDDHRLWLFQTAHFSSWYRAIALDLPGYGRSAPPQPGVTLAEIARACWQVADRFIAKGVIIHGNSVGNLIARHMAAQAPERTLALILSGGGYNPDRSAMARWVERYSAEGIGLRRAQIMDHFLPHEKASGFADYYTSMVVAEDNVATVASIVAINDAMTRPEPPEFGIGITSPTLILAGALDRNPASAFELQKRIAGSELYLIEGAGHCCNLDAPWEYDRLCLAFLAKHGLFAGSGVDGASEAE